jgi:hypothetical protein
MPSCWAFSDFKAWYGGELAYSHGIGVAATGQGMVSSPRAKQRLEKAALRLERVPGLKVDPRRMRHFGSGNTETEKRP